MRMRVRLNEEVFVVPTRVRVGYADTDRAQVVHHSTYLRYLEQARVEYLRARGYDFRKLELEEGLSLAVVEANVRYRAGAEFDDLLEIQTWIGSVNRAKLRFDSRIMRGDQLMTSAQVTCCCIELAEKKLCSIPSALIAFGETAPDGG
jgi:acyl-CoA thioester hydrolase